MDYLSSMYIDNEMDLDEKKQFVEKVRSDRAFYEQTLDLLALEQLIEIQPVLAEAIPANRWRPPIWKNLAGLFKPIGFAALGFSTAVLMFFIVFQSPVPPPVQQPVRPFRTHGQSSGTGRVVHRVAENSHEPDRQQRILGTQPSCCFWRTSVCVYPQW